MKHTLSVIIPTYNRPTELRRAVSTVANQSYEPREIVIVDDNGENAEVRAKSYAIAESATISVRVVEHVGLHGGSASRNAGAALAKGELLAFLDDDDWWEPEKLQRQVAAYQSADRQEKVGLIYTGLRVVDDKGEFLRNRPGRRPENPVRHLAQQNFIGTVSSAIIPRTVFEAVGGFDEELPARQDLDLWLRIAKHWDLLAVDEPLTVYVNHQHGISKSFDKKIRAHELFLDKHRSLYEGDRALLADYQYATGVLCLKHSRRELARDHLRRALSARLTLRALTRFLATFLPGS